MRIALLTTDGRGTWPGIDPAMPSFGTAPASLIQGFSRLPDVEVHVISCTRGEFTSPGRLADNVYFHSLRIPRAGWMSTLYLGCIRAVKRKLKEIRPDLVHGQGTERGCSMEAVFSGCPNVITIHGVMNQVSRAVGARRFSFLWLAARLENVAIRRADGVVCLTSYTRSHVGSKAKRTWIVPNAADECFFEIQRNPPGPVPEVLCVANVASYKNQNSLIRALDPLAARQRFRLVFAGTAGESSSYATEFRNLVAARPWCAHVGFAIRDQLISLLRNAHCVVLPSLEDNCPMVVLEAMAAGVPVAASRIGGIPDLIEHGVTGLLFDPRSSDGMRGAVEQLLIDRERVTRMASAGRERARERFYPEHVAREHVRIYNEVLRSRS